VGNEYSVGLGFLTLLVDMRRCVPKPHFAASANVRYFSGLYCPGAV
jgi:hypothetical protein